MDIIEDCKSVARARIPRQTLMRFLQHEGQCVASMTAALSKREGVAVCIKNKVRIKRILGSGWYMISGYREDGLDTKRAIASLIQAHIDIHGKG